MFDKYRSLLQENLGRVTLTLYEIFTSPDQYQSLVQHIESKIVEEERRAHSQTKHELEEVTRRIEELEIENRTLKSAQQKKDKLFKSFKNIISDSGQTPPKPPKQPKSE